MRILTMDRRQLLAAGGAACAGALASPSFAARPMREALVHSTSLEDFCNCELLGGAHPFWVDAAEQIVAEQAAVVRALEMRSIEVFHLRDALASAAQEAQAQGLWRRWRDRHLGQLVVGDEQAAVASMIRHVRPSALLHFAFGFAPQLRPFRPQASKDDSTLLDGLVLPLERR